MAISVKGSGGSGGATSADVTATKAQVLAGYTTITSDSNDAIVQGTMPIYNRETDASFDTCPKTTAQATAEGFTWTEIPDLCFFLNESNTNTAYQINEGMTWAEFVNSAYNTGGFSIDTEDAHPPYKYVILKGAYTIWGVSKYAEAADVIEDCSQFNAVN